MFLTDKGCLFKDKSTANSMHNILTLVDGHILTNPKPLSDDGELDLTFDEWHQAWQCLLDLIKSYIPEEFLLWEVHHLYILNHDNWAEMWPLFLAYDRGLYSPPHILSRVRGQSLDSSDCPWTLLRLFFG
jgi:hypothetical protein